MEEHHSIERYSLTDQGSKELVKVVNSVISSHGLGSFHSEHAAVSRLFHSVPQQKTH